MCEKRCARASAMRCGVRSRAWLLHLLFLASVCAYFSKTVQPERWTCRGMSTESAGPRLITAMSSHCYFDDKLRFPFKATGSRSSPFGGEP